jgi:formamidopyrimidine-DNA glycosylase
MPELPEVEVARRAIEPELLGQPISGATCRTASLRWPLDPALGRTLHGRSIVAVARRGKYLLIGCRRDPGLRSTRESAAGSAPDHAGNGDTGWLIVHLGMSGSLRIASSRTPPALHDHFDLQFGGRLLRLHDPRRFGAVLWHPDADPGSHPLLAKLGPEPFDPRLDARWLHRALAGRRGPIKPALMDSHLVVGIGNIYASECLFRAGVSPLRAAHRIAEARCGRLLDAARETLAEAIAAGGSSFRDYVHTDGGAGCFQTQTAVYERGGQPCTRCGTEIRTIRQAGRSTYYCPECQR